MTENTEVKLTLSGNVEKITYKNEQNGYTVLTLHTDDGDITVVGMMPFINEGDFVNCTGKMTFHSQYGEQFKAEFTERIIQNDNASILRYLSGGSIKGIGPATARLIVEKFGTESLEIIEKYPERLTSVRGISTAKAMSINESYLKQFGLRDILMFLSEFGITPEEALKIYRRFGNNANSFIKEDPYLLCADGIDFSFERAEEIAQHFGVPADNPSRIEAGIIYVLKKNLMNGHTCLPQDKLCSVAANLLQTDSETVENAVDLLTAKFNVISDTFSGREYIFLPEYHAAERYIAGRISAVKDYIPKVIPLDELEIDRTESILKIKFGVLQRSAIRAAVENGILILTGGPGTGKTTTLNAIIKILEYRGLNVVLTAPTGRAAQRMTELTQCEAKTIHRLLEVEWGEDSKHIFCKNERNPLECDAIIIDEMSMVDTLLFENLLRALRPGCRIIMVGDSNQLPSVGAGNILGDLIQSDIIPSVELKTVFRQAGQSQIILNAHAVINGESVDFSHNIESDFFFMKRADIDTNLSTVVELVTQRLPDAYGFSPTDNIQVLCPSRKNTLGSVNLNNVLQSHLNPFVAAKRELHYMGIAIREGDKVMQTKNNYDILWKKDNGEEGSGIFNGDIGFVETVDKRAGYLKVRFDDKVAEYMADDVGQLELAYAITVHKSQGSEFDCVVIPLYDTPSMLRYRNLLYTAITRAKKLLVIVGSQSVFEQMAANNRKTLRYTGLINYLSEAN